MKCKDIINETWVITLLYFIPFFTGAFLYTNINLQYFFYFLILIFSTILFHFYFRLIIKKGIIKL